MGYKAKKTPLKMGLAFLRTKQGVIYLGLLDIYGFHPTSIKYEEQFELNGPSSASYILDWPT